MSSDDDKNFADAFPVIWRRVRLTALICAIAVMVWFGAVAFGLNEAAKIAAVTP